MSGVAFGLMKMLQAPTGGFQSALLSFRQGNPLASSRGLGLVLERRGMGGIGWYGQTLGMDCLP